jgi:hypothetical protein
LIYKGSRAAWNTAEKIVIAFVEKQVIVVAEVECTVLSVTA